MYINYICKAIFIILKLFYLCYEFIFITDLYFKMIRIYILYLFESCMYIIELYLLKSYISCKFYLSLN